MTYMQKRPFIIFLGGILLGWLTLGIIILMIELTFPFVIRNRSIGTGRNSNSDAVSTSPSGKYLLVILSGYDGQVNFQQFEVIDKITRQVLFICPEYFRTRDRLCFAWGKDNKVWVYSGDLGTFYWEETREGNWQKRTYFGAAAPPPPDEIKRIREK